MLSLNSVCIKVHNLTLIRNFSVTFLPSAIVYLKGKNGSGKTSLLRSIAGIQELSEGNITFGKNNTNIGYLSKPYCSYIGHKTAVKPELTVIENIEFWAKIYNSYEAISAAIFYFKLEEIANRKCQELSTGQIQKVALARLLACSSQLWLLDEVENNLDSEGKDLLTRLIITKADSGGIIIASSHNEPSIKSSVIINMHDYAKNS
jgi:heme exporter protein A